MTAERDTALRWMFGTLITVQVALVGWFVAISMIVAGQEQRLDAQAEDSNRVRERLSAGWEKLDSMSLLDSLHAVRLNKIEQRLQHIDSVLSIDSAAVSEARP